MLDRDMLDASSLVLPEIGVLGSDDPRFHATIDAAQSGRRRTAF